jgi:LuxR family maltose regulon positive regulatory protein
MPETVLTTRLTIPAPRPNRVRRETAPSPLMEGLYIKGEAGDVVTGRYKYIRRTSCKRCSTRRATGKIARGNQAGARAALQQADEHPNVLTDARVQALFALRRVQLWLQQGDLAAAQAWNATLESPDPALLSGELLLISRARVLLARGRAEGDTAALHDALTLLGQLEQRARAAERWGHVLLIHILQALSYAALNQRQQARDALAEALRLGQPAGFVRVFVDEGAPMAALLTEAITRRIVPIPPQPTTFVLLRRSTLPN